ncbi:unnamed protein product [Cyprideis torosa]|uniref:GOLD domain-containing protein n=1 Tax=Cyprideis torosa TaxID=163714 RepID=A0A7R8WB24_9CRUS|nr:unnamed protein product [Cyprideis torosa]CAG0886009.1 unnamed protein product [Cyprideis torosa]
MLRLQESLVLLAHVFGLSSALMFHLQPNTQKCFSDEIHGNVFVTGEYGIQHFPNQKVDITVIDTKSHFLFNREDAPESGKFAFTTEDYDVFQICFHSRIDENMVHHARPQEISLFMKRGVEAKNYEQLGEVNKLKPLEVELKRLEDLSESITQAFAYMRKREEEMRDTNESTNSRVLYFSLFSMMCLGGLATWQVLYLRRYFKSKKLIE